MCGCTGVFLRKSISKLIIPLIYFKKINIYTLERVLVFTMKLFKFSFILDKEKGKSMLKNGYI